MSYQYDMIVLGGGAAGLTAAGMSAILGARTALISAGKLGGDCTWHGCVPSKSLLKAAKVAHQMRTADRYGLTPATPAHDFSRVIEHVHEIRQRIYEQADAPPNMEKLGVEVIPGTASFVDPHTVQLAGSARTLTARYFVIATGSSPTLPPLPGAPRVPILTNETLFELKTLPPRLLILGAGPVGIEMAQAFSRLGSQVTVISRGARILERDDPELAKMLAAVLEAEGIHLILNSSVDRHPFDYDAILCATGRQPNTASLNLSAAGVESTNSGITVNRRCRTSAKHIYACGDVVGRHLFTHMAEHTAKVAVTNALLHFPAAIDEHRVPWCTFTDPELAHAGRGEQELTRAGVAYRVYRFAFADLDRAITESASTGLVKVFAGRRGRILGASILGVNAGEMIAEWSLAMRAGVPLDKVAATLHAYPTYALGNRRAADSVVLEKLTPTVAAWIRRLFRLRGVRSDQSPRAT